MTTRALATGMLAALAMSLRVRSALAAAVVTAILIGLLLIRGEVRIVVGRTRRAIRSTLAAAMTTLALTTTGMLLPTTARTAMFRPPPRILVRLVFTRLATLGTRSM